MKLNNYNHDEYITTPEFKVTSVNFAARLAEVNLESKSDIPCFVRRQVFMIN